MKRIAAITLVGLLLAACNGEAAPEADASAEAPAYAAPPVATQVRLEAGRAVVTGRAGPDERVRLIEMDGTAHGVTADADGAFSISLPGAGAGDRLYNLSVERAGQSVSSDGWLFSPASAPERAVMLRPGGASLPVGPAPLLAVVDIDSGGGVALAGVAEGDQDVSLSLDGRTVARVRADEEGRWFSVLSSAVTPGLHRLGATAGNQRDEREVEVAAIRPAGAIETAPATDGVRVAWSLPGGGAQTTLILLPRS